MADISQKDARRRGRGGRRRLLGAIVVGLPVLAAARTINIVATTPDLAAIAREVGGDRVSVSAIARGDQNLHAIEAKPSYMMQARNADLWIRVGLQQEAGYERPILQGTRNPKILPGQPGHLDASVDIDPLEKPSDFRAAAGLTLSDVHPLGNPHYWLDPYNARVIARTIAGRLTELDPEGRSTYETHLADFLKRLDERTFGAELVEAVGGDRLWEMADSGLLEAYLAEHPTPALGGWLGRMRALRGARVVTYHRSWSYFLRRFGLETIGEIEPKPGIPPSPGHVVEVIEAMRAQRVKLILMEPYYSRQAPDRIARETGAVVVVAALSVGGQPEAPDYFGLIDNLITRLAAAAEAQGLIP